MKKLLCLIFLLPLLAMGATGDISVRQVYTDGWSAYLTIDGFVPGATYAFGYSGNNIPGANTPYLDVVSLGFDNTGAATTVTRRVYLTSTVRFPYGTSYVTGTYVALTFADGETITQATSGATAVVVGNQSSGPRLYFKSITGTFDNSHLITGGTSGATFTSTSTITTPAQPTPDEKQTATGMVVRLAMSDYIYIKDNTGGGNSGTAPTITIPASFVTNTAGAGQTSNSLSAASVTQSSAAAYQPVVANWSWPGFSVVPGNFDLRCVAFHGTSVTNGTNQVSPGTMNIACVKFTAADTHSHTATTTVTAPTYDNTVGDAVPITEFKGTMDVSTLTALDTLTCNFVAYPLVGDSTSPIDTSTGTAQPTALYGPITMLNDKSNTYGITVCAVDPVSGNDGTGVAVDIASYVAGTTAATATINKAASLIAAYNNSHHSRNDLNGGIVYLRAGNHPWTGASNTKGNAQSFWCTVMPDAGVTRAQAVIVNNTAGSVAFKDRVKYYNITLNQSNSTAFGDAVEWFDSCDLTQSSGSGWFGTIYLYFTRNVVTSLAQGFRAFSTSATTYSIIRGNTILPTGTFPNLVYTWIGNKKTGVSTQPFTIITNYASYSTAPSTQPIVAYNILNGLTVASSPLLMGSLLSGMTGQAIVQNVMENYKDTTGPLCQIAADNSTGSTAQNNVIYWNNTWAGQRQNLSYNDDTSNAPLRLYWSEKNNLFYDYNIKTDTFPTANGARIGNWSDVYGVSFSGNLVGDSGNGFNNDFNGFGSLYHDWAGGGSSQNYFLFTTYGGAVVGSSDGSGAGVYTLQVTSPARGLQYDLLVPYDAAGALRLTTDATGAYSQGGGTTPFVGFWKRR